MASPASASMRRRPSTSPPGRSEIGRATRASACGALPTAAIRSSFTATGPTIRRSRRCGGGRDRRRLGREVNDRIGAGLGRDPRRAWCARAKLRGPSSPGATRRAMQRSMLGIYALTAIAPVAPGSPLCRAHSDRPGARRLGDRAQGRPGRRGRISSARCAMARRDELNDGRSPQGGRMRLEGKDRAGHRRSTRHRPRDRQGTRRAKERTVAIADINEQGAQEARARFPPPSGRALAIRSTWPIQTSVTGMVQAIVDRVRPGRHPRQQCRDRRQHAVSRASSSRSGTGRSSHQSHRRLSGGSGLRPRDGQDRRRQDRQHRLALGPARRPRPRRLRRPPRPASSS